MPVFAALAFLFLMLAPSASASSAIPENIDFAVFRDGDQIGHHRVTFARNGEDIIASVDIELAVSFAGVRLFYYKHDAKEVWRSGSLMGLQSVTYNDGDDERLNLRRDGERLAIEGTEYQGVAPVDLVPSSYWFMDTVQQSQIIDSQNGRIFPVEIRKIGREAIEAGGRTVEATRYTLSEQLVMNLWYDDAGNWVKTSFESDGSLIDYVLQPRQQRAAAN